MRHFGVTHWKFRGACGIELAIEIFWKLVICLCLKGALINGSILILPKFLEATHDFFFGWVFGNSTFLSRHRNLFLSTCLHLDAITPFSFVRRSPHWSDSSRHLTGSKVSGHFRVDNRWFHHARSRKEAGVDDGSILLYDSLGLILAHEC